MLTRPASGNHVPGTGKGENRGGMYDNLLLALFCFFAAFFCYQTVIPLVFPEMAYFYQMYGNTPGPTLQQVLSAYSIFQPGWYRPTSFFLFPYLLSLNYLNPAGVVAFNIIFFALTCSLVPILFLPISDLPTKLLSSAIILTAPALVAVTYFPAIDSLHILFSLFFIKSFEGLVVGHKNLTRSSLLLTFWYLAAVTSKESTIIIPFLAFLYTIILNIDRLERRRLFRRAVSLALPYLLISAAYYWLYMVSKGILSDPVYTNIPTIHKLPKILKLLYATLNLHLSIVPGENLPTAGYHQTGNLTWAAIWLLTTGLIWWRHKKIHPLSQLSFLLILASLYLLSGMAGGHFHHVFPMMVCLAILIGRLSTFPEKPAALLGGTAPPRSQAFKRTVQLILVVGLVFSSNAYITDILEHGAHRRELQINTALFHDRQLMDLAHRQNIHLLVEGKPWDIGGTTGVLRYYGRNSTGGASEEYVDSITPEKIRQVTLAHPNKIIFGLSLQAGDHPYSIRQLWPRSSD